MSDGPRWPEYPRPRHWSDDEHRQAVDDEAGPESWPDVEWSTDQTFVGEFGQLTQFGEPID